jgi:hypothetical protein
MTPNILGSLSNDQENQLLITDKPVQFEKYLVEVHH